jgi:predicted RNase H-like HicB family nuclease
MTDDTNLPEGGQYYDTLLFEEFMPDGQVIWTAVHPELQGCSATGKNDTEALENLTVARDSWLEIADRLGHQIPTPKEFLSVQRVFASRPGVRPTVSSDVENPEMIQREFEIAAA